MHAAIAQVHLLPLQAMRCCFLGQRTGVDLLPGALYEVSEGAKRRGKSRQKSFPETDSQPRGSRPKIYVSPLPGKPTSAKVHVKSAVRKALEVFRMLPLHGRGAICQYFRGMIISHIVKGNLRSLILLRTCRCSRCNVLSSRGIFATDGDIVAAMTQWNGRRDSPGA